MAVLHDPSPAVAAMGLQDRNRHKDQIILNMPLRGFISYRHIDNQDFNLVVDRLRQDLASTYAATTGDSLDLFLDRESIGWGIDWRKRIDEAVRNSTFFIPIITMRYFESRRCIDELMAFEAAATSRKVSPLLLPIVLLGSQELDRESPRASIELIRNLQYKTIENAWRAGYDSHLWREAIHDIVTFIRVALLAVEPELEALAMEVSRDLADPGIEPGFVGDGGGEVCEAEETRVRSTLGRSADSLTDFINAFETCSGLIVAARSKLHQDEIKAADFIARMVRLEADLSSPAGELNRAGNRLLAAVMEADTQLRQFLNISEIEDHMSQARNIVRMNARELESGSEDFRGYLAEARPTLNRIGLRNIIFRETFNLIASGYESAEIALATVGSWATL